MKISLRKNDWRYPLAGLIAAMLAMIIYTGLYPVDNTTDVPTLKQEMVQSEVNQDASSNIQTKTYYRVPLSLDEQDLLFTMCTRYNLDVDMVLGVMYVESKFDTQAKNNKCLGIMQVNEMYYNHWLESDSDLVNQYKTIGSTQYDYYLNTIAGCRALYEWRTICIGKKLGGINDMLGAYNGGYDYLAHPTSEYADKVFAYTKTLKKVQVIM